MLRATLKSLLAHKLRLRPVRARRSCSASSFVVRRVRAHRQPRQGLRRPVHHRQQERRGRRPRRQGHLRQPGRRRPRPAARRTCVDTVEQVDGVKEAQGQVQGSAQLVGKDGKAVGTGGAPTLGFNWYRLRRCCRPAPIVEGQAPHGPDEIADQPRAAATARTTSSATRHPVPHRPAAEDVQDRRHRRVRRQAHPSPARPTSSSTTPDRPAGAATSTASSPRSRSRPTSGVGADRAARPDPPAAARQTRGHHRHAARPTSRPATCKKGLGFFNTFLLIFALIALFVGAFIIFNTFSMLVAQRTRELALMRALGASRGQVTPRGAARGGRGRAAQLGRSG